MISPMAKLSRSPSPLTPPTLVRRLALFRYRLRQFLRFSENAARSSGITPQQHQLLLGVAGFTGRGWATISELAEFLQEQHNAVVGLVQRAERRGFLEKRHTGGDQRFVGVRLRPKGEKLLRKLSRLSHGELKRFRGGVLPAFVPREKGARRGGNTKGNGPARAFQSSGTKPR